MKTPVVLSIVIVSYNTRDLIRQCINSVLHYDRRLYFGDKAISSAEEEKFPTEIIIVDNGSTDGSREYLKELKSQNSKVKSKDKKQRKLKDKSEKLKVKVIFNKDNLGFAKANNQAMRQAEGEYILLLNSDTIIKEAAISQTLLWLSSHPEYDLVGCKLINQDGSTQPSVGHFPSLLRVFQMLFFDRWGNQKVMFVPTKPTKVDWVMGAFMLLKKDIFRQTKGFDEKFFMYMEEVEWCYRLKNMGFRIGFYPNAKIVHLGGKSSPEGRRTPIINIYRGLIYFYRQHKSKSELFWLRLMLKTKAIISLNIGLVTQDDYLKSTYREAFNLA